MSNFKSYLIGINLSKANDTHTYTDGKPHYGCHNLYKMVWSKITTEKIDCWLCIQLILGDAFDLKSIDSTSKTRSYNFNS